MNFTNYMLIIWFCFRSFKQRKRAEIEQWTTALTTYVSLFTHKYPVRAQEFLQYLSLIRYAARAHKGLGWATYDHKFRQKASLNKALVWSQIDQHLWRTIFTVSPLALKEEYPLFKDRPQSNASKGGVRDICHQYNRVGVCSRDQCEYQHICNRCKDSDRMEARLPPDKVQRPTQCFTEFRGRRSCTLKELQSPIGSEVCL